MHIYTQRRVSPVNHAKRGLKFMLGSYGQPSLTKVEGHLAIANQLPNTDATSSYDPGQPQDANLISENVAEAPVVFESAEQYESAISQLFPPPSLSTNVQPVTSDMNQTPNANSDEAATSNQVPDLETGPTVSDSASQDVAATPVVLETFEQYASAIAQLFPQPSQISGTPSSSQSNDTAEAQVAETLHQMNGLVEVESSAVIASQAVQGQMLEVEAPLIVAPPSVNALTHAPAATFSAQSKSPLVSNDVLAASSTFVASFSAQSIQASSSAVDATLAPSSSDTMTYASSSQWPVSSEAASLPHVSSALHPAQFYVGVALGTIAALVCGGALGVWWLRVRMSKRRRAHMNAIGVPWRRDSFDDTYLVRSDAYIDSTTDIEGSRALDIDGEKVVPHAWEPRGDRDVGEPKRDEILRGNVSTYLDAPEHNLTGPRSSYPFSSTPQLPLYDTSSREGHASLGPLKVANKLPGDCLSSTETSRAGTALGMIHSTSPREMLRSPRSTAPIVLDKAPTLSIEGELDSALSRTTEAWTTSLKANLVSAFNAVSAGINPGSPSQSIDRLTPAPHRRGLSGRRVVSAQNGEEGWKRLTSSDAGASLSRRSTVSHTAWALEDRGDGSGVVHIRDLNKGDFLPPTPLAVNKKHQAHISTDDTSSEVPDGWENTNSDNRRPSFISRSSASSTDSSGSHVSELTDNEQEAQKVLKERRRKLMEAKVSRQARQSRRRAGRVSVKRL
ncbi:hypothetical protein HGRIS_014143 [Hohenbuehelia grisea]|uniref:Uncharacterized protein n=1 Tax=Hohenbuehelia grisea TaxID=104357 RepID=A0ABR3JUG6_9AGAR